MKWLKSLISKKDNTSLKIELSNKLRYLSSFIDKPVIIIPSNVSNPIIGVGQYISEDTDGSLILVVRDYVTNTDIEIANNIYHYRYSFLEHYFNTELEFIYDLLYPDRLFREDINDTLLKNLYNLTEITTILKRNGFYESNCMRS